MTDSSSDKHISRRDFLAGGAGLAAGLALPGAALAGARRSHWAARGSKGGTLRFWWWAEQDAPGANKWLKEVAAAFERETGWRISVAEQQTNSLTPNFQAAAAARSGPDLASQWATGPILTQAWNGAIDPISDLVPASERAHWLYTQENAYGGKLWSVPIYIIGQPFVYNPKLFAKAGLDPKKPPRTWDQLIAACKQLQRKGITPLGLGNKDTFGGRWMWAFLAVQTLDSLDDLRHAVIGDASFTDPKFSGWMERLKELIDNKFFNDDVMSLDFGKGFDVFGSGKAAMSWSTEGNVKAWAKALGAAAVSPTPMPRFGNGKLANAYTATQSTSFFVTSWAKDHDAGAEFFKFAHRPEWVNRWYKHTTVLPADNRFDKSRIKSKLGKQLVELATHGPQIWLENWIPPQLDEQANGPAGQLLFTGGSVKEAAQLWDRAAKTWRAQKPKDLKRVKAWQMKPVVLR